MNGQKDENTKSGTFQDQTIRSVRAVGVGPMIAGSPGPAQLGDQQQSCASTQQQFLAPVEIRQFPQNARLWTEQRPIGDGGAATQMDAQFHPTGTQSIMVPQHGQSTGRSLPTLSDAKWRRIGGISAAAAAQWQFPIAVQRNAIVHATNDVRLKAHSNEWKQRSFICI